MSISIMVDVTDLDGVASGRAENLAEAGYESVEDVANGDPEIMAEVVNYLPEDTALSLVVQAQDMLEEESSDSSSEGEGTTLDGDASITEEISEAAEETSDSLEKEEEVLDEVDEDLKEEIETAVEDVDEESLDEELDELEEEMTEDKASEEPEPEEWVEPTTETSEEPEPEKIVFELTLETPMQYDTLYDCVMDQRATLIRTNRDGVDEFSEVLDIVREASYGETVELSMDEATLNDLHNAVRKKSVTYKGDNLIEHMDAVNKILAQVNSARDEHLF